MDFKICDKVKGFLNDLCKNCSNIELYLYLRYADMGFVFDDIPNFKDSVDDDIADKFDDVNEKNYKKVDNFIDSIGGSYGFDYFFAKELVNSCYDEIADYVENSPSAEEEFNKPFD